MKIAFLASVYATPIYKNYYTTIINYLIQKRHSVNHLLSYSEESLSLWNQEKKENLFFNFYKKIRESDLAIAECSYPNINVGYQISHAIQHEKEIIILKSADSNLPINSGVLYSDKNSYIYNYNKSTLLPILKEALEFNAPRKYKKFNVLFAPDMVAKLNLISKKKNLPKSVYIRQLIEKSLAMEELE